VARFDVYANPDATDRKSIPFLLDVQNDFLEGLESRVVVPLWAASAFKVRLRGLNPELRVNDRAVVMDTAALGAVPLPALRRAVANVSGQQLHVLDALDTLLGGY
jgi:toxin CcdB